MEDIPVAQLAGQPRDQVLLADSSFERACWLLFHLSPSNRYLVGLLPSSPHCKVIHLPPCTGTDNTDCVHVVCGPETRAVSSAHVKTERVYRALKETFVCLVFLTLEFDWFWFEVKNPINRKIFLVNQSEPDFLKSSCGSKDTYVEVFIENYRF